MRKEIVLSLLVASLTTGLQAGGDIGGITSFENADNAVADKAAVEVKAPVVKVEPKVEPKVEEKSDAGFYTVLKGLYITGDEHDGLDADDGYGAGLDLGYRFGNGLSTELGASFAKNDIDNAVGNEASYKTMALSLVYTMHLSETVGAFVKGGYLYEQEKVNGLGIDEDDSGFAYGGGLEYMMDDTYGLVAEYETSTIDSIRGDAVSLGLMVNF